MKEFTLKQVCEITGASRRAVQGYEALGMVKPSGRNKYGHLIYDDVALVQIKNIKFYRDMGFTGKATKVLLECSEELRKEMIHDRISALHGEINKLQRLIYEAEQIIS